MTAAARPLAAAVTAALYLFAALPQPANAQSPAAASAAPYDYQLQPQQVADGVYVVLGHNEDFSPHNGGNIANVGILIGDDGVVLIDSGPSRRYGEQLQAAVTHLTPLPVVMVIHTHHHPDHVLGAQVFTGAQRAALPEVQQQLASEGGTLLDNMYRLNGAWMQGTQPSVMDHPLTPGRLQVAGRELELIQLTGHSAADLVIMDVASGTLFAGDLVFHDRAPTTPHANLPQWLTALDALEALQATTLVPGHGPLSPDGKALAQTRAYLQWLGATLADGAERGLDTTELFAQPLPAEFAALAVGEAEFRRSVIQLYPAFERAALQPARPTQP
jgi:uncharacterized sulfatase